MRNVDQYQNEPFLNFDFEENKKAMEHALISVEHKFGQTYPLIINGKEITTENKIDSINPADTSIHVGYLSAAGTNEAEMAHHAAREAFETWKYTSAKERSHYLTLAAQKIRERRFEFNAWLIHESGKNWREADADVAEAIDFLEYYAKLALDLDNPPPLTEIREVTNPRYVPFVKEDTKLTYIPLGVGICLPPWNFPLAILVGMSASAIVTGNTIVLKPSELTGVIAYQFVQLMHEIGLPPGVINLVTGYGSEIGDYLVEHPQTRFISFTGSKITGCRIFEKAAKVQPGQKWLKRVIAEMGGKDGIVVDETADLERAAQSIVDAAFGFQGQKCSAGSRAIIVESVYDEVLGKVIEKTKKLQMGSPVINAAIGPVSDKRAFDKINAYIEIGKTEGTLLLGGTSDDSVGYYIDPTIFGDVTAEHRIFQEEIFGPVLTFTRAKDYKEAISLYNDTEYGLTGAFHSTNEVRISEALVTMECGNLYINKKCTGALVGVHPFGGYNMSGTDSKAGGPDYLLQFVQAKALARIRN